MREVAHPAGRRAVEVVDSHTGGEPTRVVLRGAPSLKGVTVSQKLAFFRTNYDSFRTGVVLEPRGSEAMVGALLVEPEHTSSVTGVIYFNDVGYLGMCGHGTIGLVTTLAYLGRIAPGSHRIETPVGVVSTLLHADGRVSVESVPSYRYRAAVVVEVPGLGQVCGDVAWGGNWFFLAQPPRAADGSRRTLHITERAGLIAAASAIRLALAENGITGEANAAIDHVEFFSGPADPQNSGRNFVLCPGASFDRSPCGTGTSAKMACLHAEGSLRPGKVWRQEGILNTVFEGSIKELAPGEGQGSRVLPTITGRAWITAESTLLFHEDDPFAGGVHLA